ncbi:hypothetical protein IFM89_025826 [Coptis chinensis]|uniref:UBC core domain-containing protein n=1 Tax=Coptis chinensis TaxID=261450 RepID=A0A835HJU9_9MAGN|nr:hypothetical protein IFM89_025826 [Coptis chinensis]
MVGLIEIEIELDRDRGFDFGERNREEGLKDKGGSRFSARPMSNFGHFGIVTDVSDHHFREQNKDLEDGEEYSKKFEQIIKKEWNILERNLEGSILVRVYGDRIDLLRAVITGTPGTIYNNGLFLFDFCLPRDCPARPPLMYYYSLGIDLSDNLPKSGEVCLSHLLKKEWSASSTVLEILHLLQTHILNRPHLQSGKISLVVFNVVDCLMTFKTMPMWLKRPPKHFEDFVEEHFRENTSQILSFCRTYCKQTGIVLPDLLRQLESMCSLSPRISDSLSSKRGFLEDFRTELTSKPSPKSTLIAAKRKIRRTTKKAFSKLKKAVCVALAYETIPSRTTF